MKKLDEETKRNLDILKAFDNALKEGPWGYDNFFKAIGAKLQALRDRFRDDLNLQEIEETINKPSVAHRLAEGHGLVEVFILLYNADGDNIVKWEQIIQSLKSKMINRPIYNEESLAKAALRGATQKQNEGYLSVFVSAETIIKLAAEKIPRDRWGNELLLLNEGAVRLPNISRFVHVSGLYEVENGKLIRQDAADFL